MMRIDEASKELLEVVNARSKEPVPVQPEASDVREMLVETLDWVQEAEPGMIPQERRKA